MIREFIGRVIFKKQTKLLMWRNVFYPLMQENN